VEPDRENSRKYAQILPVFDLATGYLAQVSDALREVEL